MRIFQPPSHRDHHGAAGSAKAGAASKGTPLGRFWIQPFIQGRIIPLTIIDHHWYELLVHITWVPFLLRWAWAYSLFRGMLLRTLSWPSPWVWHDDSSLRAYFGWSYHMYELKCGYITLFSCHESQEKQWGEIDKRIWWPGQNIQIWFHVVMSFADMDPYPEWLNGKLTGNPDMWL